MKSTMVAKPKIKLKMKIIRANGKIEYRKNYGFVNWLRKKGWIKS